MEKSGTAGKAEDDNKLHEFTSWINKVTDIHSEYLILPAFHGING